MSKQPTPEALTRLVESWDSQCLASRSLGVAQRGHCRHCDTVVDAIELFAELRAEVEQLSKDRYDEARRAKSAEAEVKRLRLKNGELGIALVDALDDTARLDWLETHSEAELEWYASGEAEDAGFRSVHFNGSHPGPTVRDAIDAAMEDTNAE